LLKNNYKNNNGFSNITTEMTTGILYLVSATVAIQAKNIVLMH